MARSLVVCNPYQIFFGDQIEKTEMGGACSTFGGEVKCMQGFGGET